MRHILSHVPHSTGRIKTLCGLVRADVTTEEAGLCEFQDNVIKGYEAGNLDSIRLVDCPKCFCDTAPAVEWFRRYQPWRLKSKS